MRESGPSTLHARISLLGDFAAAIQVNGAWQEAVGWSANYNARRLVAYLAVQPQRRATREAIYSRLWPETFSAVQYLKAAVSELRRVMQDETILTYRYGHALLQLADATRLEVDLDAGFALLEAAEQASPATEQGLTLLEQARPYFDPGIILGSETGSWVQSIRDRVQKQRRRCLHWLAHAYQAHGRYRDAEELAEQLLEEDPTDEQALIVLMQALHRQGETGEALRRYQQVDDLFVQHKRKFSVHMELLVRRLQQEPRYTSYLVTDNHHPPSSFSRGGDIIETNETSEGRDMDLFRRQFLEFLAFSAPAMSVEDLLMYGYVKKGVLDPLSLNFFESEMDTRWEMYHTGGTRRALKGLALWITEIEHAAYESRSTQWYQRFQALMCLSYQLQGSLHRDLMNYGFAHTSYDTAFALADTLDDPELKASAYARKGVTYIQQRNPTNAIDYLQGGYTFVKEKELPSLKGYILQALSEAYAIEGDGKSSSRYIDLASKMLAGRTTFGERSHCGLSTTSVTSQMGVNCVWLRDYQTAIQFLEEGLKQYSPTLIRGKARLLAQKAEAYYGLTATGQQRALDECSTTAAQAVLLAQDAGSTKTVERVQTLQSILEQSPWKEEKAVTQLGQLLSQRRSHA